MLFEQYDTPVPYGAYDRELPPESEGAAEYQWMYYTRKELRHKLIAGDYSEIEKTVDALLIKQGLAPDDIDKSTPEYSRLCHGLMRAEIKGLDRYEKNLHGEFKDDLEEVLNDHIPAPSIQTGILAPSPTPANTTPKPVDHGPLLSEFMEKFPETKPNWDIATHKAYQTTTKVVLKILGDIHVGTITRAIMVDYRETLLKSPAYWTNRHPQIRVEDLPATGLPTIGKSTLV